PGLFERPYSRGGNGVPGAMRGPAAGRVLTLSWAKPGRRALVLPANAEGDAAAADLSQAGVEVARIIDARAGGDLVRVRGHRGVRAVELPGGGTVDCDLVVTAVGWTAPTSLLNMSGDQPSYNPRAARFFPGAWPPAGLATGGIAGDGTREELIGHAEAVGREAARRAARLRREWRAALPAHANGHAEPHARWGLAARRSGAVKG